MDLNRILSNDLIIGNMDEYSKAPFAYTNNEEQAVDPGYIREQFAGAIMEAVEWLEGHLAQTNPSKEFHYQLGVDSFTINISARWHGGRCE